MSVLGDILRAAHGFEERSLVPASVSTLAAPSDGLVLALTGGVAGGISTEKAIRLGAAYACIRVLADSVASIPLVVYKRSPVGRERVTAGITVDRLRYPSAVMTQANLWATVMAHLQGWGNAYLVKYRGGPDGGVAGLGVIHPSQVGVEVRFGEPYYRINGVDGEATRRDVCHIKGMTLDGFMGVSPTSQARGAFALAQSLEDVASGLMANGARPSGVLRHPSRLTDSAAARLKGSFRRLTSGANAGDVVVLEEGLEYTPLSLSPEDAQLIEQRKMSVVDIARVFRVPPYMIAADAGGSLTYSNVEQETASFITHSVRPWLTYIEQALAADEDLFPRGSDTYPEFLIDAFLRSDAKTRAEIYAVALDPVKGWMTRAEVRQRENLSFEPATEPAPAVQPPSKEAVA